MKTGPHSLGLECDPIFDFLTKLFMKLFYANGFSVGYRAPFGWL